MKIQRTENHGTVLSLTDDDIQMNAERVYRKVRGYRFDLLVVPDGWKEDIKSTELFHLISPCLFIGAHLRAEIIEA